MHRNKVFELAMEAGLFSAEVTVLMPKLERFAALIEREVRGDAEPVAWMYEWDGKKHLTFTDQRPIEQSHPHFNKSAPLYTHPVPTNAPAVVRQLVDALRRVMDLDCPLTGNPSHVELVEHWEYEKTQGRGEADDRLFALAALAAAKEAGL